VGNSVGSWAPARAARGGLTLSGELGAVRGRAVYSGRFQSLLGTASGACWTPRVHRGGEWCSLQQHLLAGAAPSGDATEAVDLDEEEVGFERGMGREGEGSGGEGRPEGRGGGGRGEGC